MGKATGVGLIKFLVLLSATQFSSGLNNVCESFRGYYTPNLSKSCHYDPDTSLEVPDLIRKYIGTEETYTVTSPDGYILTVFRMPRTNPKGVILLEHPLNFNSRIFLWQGNNSLALTLWRNGFDVWLPNNRGTSYSNKHVNLTTHDREYWNFYMYELGFYDVPTHLELIRQKTNGAKVTYIGHSLGSSAGVVYSSVKSEEARNYLHSAILLGTPTYYDSGSTFVYIMPFVRVLAAISSSPLGDFLPLVRSISKTVFRIFPTTLYIVNVVLLALFGYTPKEVDPQFFNYDCAMYLDNFAWKIMLHIDQLLQTKNKFQMYDYGRKKNLKLYGQEAPPAFPVQNISVPLLLVASYNDALIPLGDSETLLEHMSPDAKVQVWKLSGLNHLDYFYGLHRHELVVNNLTEFINQLYDTRR